MIALIPSYEPAEHLPTLVTALAAADPGLGIVVVDDGSGPAYASIFARAAAAGATILRHDRNLGKGAALKTGLAHVHGVAPSEGVVSADADGQHTCADIVAVADRVRALGERESRTLVLGCRTFDGAVPLRSRLGNDISRRLFRAAAGWPLSDTQTGLRGFPAALVPWLIGLPGERFEYEQRMLLGLHGAGFTAEEIPIATVYLAGNESSHFRPVLDSVRVTLPTLVFAASSLLGFAVDTIALFLLQAATGALVPSIIAARLVSASVNFFVNRRVVFLRRGREGMWRQLGSYVLLAAVLLASNIVWLSYLTGIGMSLWGAKLLTEIVLFCTSYRTQRSSVFAPAYRAGGISRTAVADSSPHTAC